MKKRDNKTFLKDTIAAAAALGIKNANGDPFAAVAIVLGVSRATLYHWVNRASPKSIPVGHALALAALAKIDVREFAR